MAFSNVIKILVVEDTPGDVFLIKFYLEEIDPENYEIQSVGNLADAHYKLEREAFDVVLLDLNLPDSEGMITLKKTIEKFPEEVYIVLTALSDEKIGLEAVKNGAQDFLVKGRIDSKILDSSIKFSFQRSKLKKAVKIFGESLKAIENMHNFYIVIIDMQKSIVYHSKNLNRCIGIENISIDSLDQFQSFFTNGAEIVEAINSCELGNTIELNSEINAFKCIVKLNKPIDLNGVLVATIAKIYQ